MKNLNLNDLTSQIENIYSKYNKQIPTIKYIKFDTHSVLTTDEWEFYFTKISDMYVLSNVVNSRYTDDISLHKIKAYIVCEILNNVVLPI